MAQAPLHKASVAQDEERKAASSANWKAGGGSKCTDALRGRSGEGWNRRERERSGEGWDQREKGLWLA